MLAFGDTCNVSGHLSGDMHAEKATGPDTQQLYKSTVNISWCHLESEISLEKSRALAAFLKFPMANVFFFNTQFETFPETADSSNPGTVVEYNLKMILKHWGNKTQQTGQLSTGNKSFAFIDLAWHNFYHVYSILWVSHSVLISLPVFRFICQFVIITHWLIMFACTVPGLISYCQSLSVFIMWYLFQFACFALCFTHIPFV